MIYLKRKLHSQTFRSLVILWGAVAISVLIVFFPFLTGDGLVVWNDAGSDTRQQYLMHYATIVNHLKDGNYSLWDMNLGFGASLFALNPFHLFLLPVYLLGVVFGTGHIPTFLLFMMIAQFFLAGTLCYLFLSCFSLSESGKVIAAYLYTFCGYLLVWGQHYHFGAFAVFLPLLLFLLERAMQWRRFSPAVPLVVALMVCSSTYMSYMSLLMAGAYLLYRAILEDGAPARRAQLFLARCGEILLGLGLGAFAFLPSVHFLTTVSSRLGAKGSFLGRMWEYCSLFPAEFYRTAFLRFFSTTFEGIAQYNGYSNLYEAPVLFFGVLFVILLPQYLFSIRRQEASRKAKILQYVAVLFFVFCMFVRLGASIFNGFAYPFSRHSFIFMPLFALVTAKALDEIRIHRHLSVPALILSAALLICACCTALPQLSAAEPYGWNIVTDVIATGVLGVMMIVLLVLLSRAGRSRFRRVVTVLLFLCVIANVTGEGWLCYNARDVLTTTNADYWGPLYDPDVDAALAWLKENDPTFYRLEKDYYAGSYCMDALEQGYHGISAYNSTPNRGIEELVNFVIPNFPIMARYEYTFRQIGYYSGHSTLFGIKYLLSRTTDPKPDGFRQIGQFGNLYLYQNDDVSSFARFYTKAGDSTVLKKAYGKADLETMLLDVALLDVNEDAEREETTNADTDNADTSNALTSVQGLSEGALLSADELLSQYALEEIAMLDDVTAGGDSDTIFLALGQNETQTSDTAADQSIGQAAGSAADQAADQTTGRMRDLSDYEHVYLEFDIETPTVCDFALNPGSSMEYLFRTKAGIVSHVQMPVPDFCEKMRLHSYSGPFSAQISHIRLLGSKAAPAETPQANIIVNDTANDSQLSGSISTEEDGLLFLPLPYEEGWTASVDGEGAQLLRTDLGFISIPVKAGEHSFMFTYHQPWMQVGVYVSIFSVILWTVLTVLQKREKNLTARNRRTTTK